MYRPAISFTAPYRVYLPDEFFNVRTSDGVSLVKALPLPAVGAPGLPHVYGAAFEVQHDIFGFAGRTRFHVVLSAEFDPSLAEWQRTVSDQAYMLLEAAINAVNRVLAVYRDRDVNAVGRNSFHVVELVRGDISDVELVVVNSNLDKADDFFEMWPGFRSMGFGSATDRADGVIASIRTDLATNAAIPLERELISSARNHLWRHQLRLVPVQANTAFEAFAMSLQARLNPHRTMHEKAEFIDKLKAIESAMAAAYTANSKIFTPWFDSSAAGYAGMHNAELSRWYQDCYLLRNKVIHRGFNEVTFADAKNALDSTIRAIEFLNSMVASTGK